MPTRTTSHAHERTLLHRLRSAHVTAADGVLLSFLITAHEGVTFADEGCAYVRGWMPQRSSCACEPAINVNHISCTSAPGGLCGMLAVLRWNPEYSSMTKDVKHRREWCWCASSALQVTLGGIHYPNFPQAILWAQETDLWSCIVKPSPPRFLTLLWRKLATCQQGGLHLQ